MQNKYKANPAPVWALVLIATICFSLILSACGNDTNGQSTVASMTVEANQQAGGIKAAPTPPAADTPAAQPTTAPAGSPAAGGQTTTAAAGGGNATGDSAKGLALFQSSGCTSCHAGLGKQAGGIGPQLSTDPKITGAAFVVNQLRNAAAPMPKYPATQISDPQANDLAAYILSIRGK